TAIGYIGLFWVDGITCIAAGLLLLYILNPKKAKVLDNQKNPNPTSAYKDLVYWIFILAMILFGFAFVQYFSTVPLYYSRAYELSELQIGLLLALNGLLIFALEMPLIKYMEGKPWSKITNMIAGFVLVGLSFLALNIFSWIGILIIGMLLLTLGEMIAFPFSNAYAMERSKKGNQGEYMALYSIAFSISHVFAHNYGMRSISNYGFDITWYAIDLICVLGILLLLLLKNTLTNTKKNE
ncbi:MAG: MFS transporter, partial [Flavobacteriales bacterium]